ncbi:hypothetical protein ACIBHX_12550 [Nonomuraea sp. NPDC050536]|uniref:hypothetical protein n=1 Tax=Nonomuraea sp. NPDC050536 TaxID=3364366 RepID=UPI0037CBCB53
MRKITCLVAAMVMLLVAGCTQRDSRHPIAIAIAGGTQRPAVQQTQTRPRTPGPAGSLSPADAQAKLTQCIRQNGIDMPDPGSPEAKNWRYTGDQATLQKALKACEQYAKQLPNPYDDPKVRDQLVKFAQCMRKQGIDMPDPPQQNWNLNPNDPSFQKAMQACSQFVPSLGGSQ